MRALGSGLGDEAHILRHKMAQSAQPQVVAVGPLEDVVHRIETRHAEAVAADWNESDLLQTRKTADATVLVVACGIEDPDLQGASPVVAAPKR